MIHIICDRFVSNDGLLRLIGRTDFWVALGRRDCATNGGEPDPRDLGIPRERTLAHRQFNAGSEEEELIGRRNHNFP
jgi:error-prone DNA polymerase